MNQYAVCHVSKGKGESKGLTAHNERERTPDNADPALSHLNIIDTSFHILGDDLDKRARSVIEKAGITRKVQANAVLFCPIILSGSHEQMKQIEASGRLKEWADDNRRFIENRFGKENLISFAMHADERTPHIHASIVPIIHDENKKGVKVARLSAKDTFDVKQLKQLQDDYAKAMRKWGLERGMDSSITKAKHVDIKTAYRDLPKIIESKQGEVKSFEAILKPYNENKKLYDEFRKGFFENTKVKPLIAQIEELKKEVGGLKEELKTKDNTISELTKRNNALSRAEAEGWNPVEHYKSKLAAAEREVNTLKWQLKNTNTNANNRPNDLKR